MSAMRASAWGLNSAGLEFPPDPGGASIEILFVTPYGVWRVSLINETPASPKTAVPEIFSPLRTPHPAKSQPSPRTHWRNCLHLRRRASGRTVYMNARYYDPGTGRFITQDSYLGKPDDPRSLHRYEYAFANPAMWVDPTGHGNEIPHAYQAAINAQDAGMSNQDAALFGIYSQFPDEAKELDATDNSLSAINPFGSVTMQKAAINNAGLHVLTGLRADAGREVARDYVANQAQTLMEAGIGNHPLGDSDFHITKDTLDTDREMAHTPIKGHLFEMHDTDYASKYPNKFKRAQDDTAGATYRFAIRTGRSQRPEDDFGTATRNSRAALQAIIRDPALELIVKTTQVKQNGTWVTITSPDYKTRDEMISRSVRRYMESRGIDFTAEPARGTSKEGGKYLNQLRDDQLRAATGDIQNLKKEYTAEERLHVIDSLGKDAVRVGTTIGKDLSERIPLKARELDARDKLKQQVQCTSGPGCITTESNTSTLPQGTERAPVQQ